MSTFEPGAPRRFAGLGGLLMTGVNFPNNDAEADFVGGINTLRGTVKTWPGMDLNIVRDAERRSSEAVNNYDSAWKERQNLANTFLQRAQDLAIAISKTQPFGIWGRSVSQDNQYYSQMSELRTVLTNYVRDDQVIIDRTLAGIQAAKDAEAQRQAALSNGAAVADAAYNTARQLVTDTKDVAEATLRVAQDVTAVGVAAQTQIATTAVETVKRALLDANDAAQRAYNAAARAATERTAQNMEGTLKALREAEVARDDAKRAFDKAVAARTATETALVDARAIVSRLSAEQAAATKDAADRAAAEAAAAAAEKAAKDKALQERAAQLALTAPTVPISQIVKALEKNPALTYIDTASANAGALVAQAVTETNAMPAWQKVGLAAVAVGGMLMFAGDLKRMSRSKNSSVSGYTRRKRRNRR